MAMLVVLTVGLSLWIVYGFIRGDWIIMAANGIGATLSGLVLTFKVRDSSGSNCRRHHSQC